MELPDGQGVIARLCEHNLFISALDEHQHWFRLHDLFRDWLRQQVSRARDIDGVS